MRTRHHMKRILHISKYYYPFPGGTEQIARDCVFALKNDYEQKVIAFNDCKEDKKIQVDGVEIIKCGTFAKIASQSLSLSFSEILHKQMEDFNPDILVFHYPNPFAAACIMRELKKHPDIIFVVYWHLDIMRQKFLKHFFKGQNTNLLTRANLVIATSPNYIEGSKWLQSVKGKCVVIPNCINVERMELTPEIKYRANQIREENKSRIICVSVGRHTKYKGVSYLIQASKLLDDKFRFYIVGKGELTEQLRKEAGEDSKIVFTGCVNDMELKALILASDIFCFPSITKNEAFGLALAEAMYYEKPAITFTIPGSGVNYVCLDGENGIEVKSQSARGYADAIKRLSKDPGLREQYGKAGKRRVIENFLSTQFYENVRNAFAQVSEL